ncbi:MAG: nucleotidyltransferase [Candidatus Sumerlaeaceae bacterium]
MIQLPPDFREFLRLLQQHGVEYLLVGGYAVAYYGYPRATIDLDIWIPPRIDNAAKVINTLEEFGFSDPGVTPEFLCRENQMLRMGVPPLRLELMNSVSGLRFEDSYRRRVLAEIDGVLICLVKLEDLIVNKRASNRPKDQNDLLNLPS